MRVAFVAVFLAVVLGAFDARADDVGLRGTRIGFVPTIGVAATEFTGQRPYFNSFVGESVIQLDFIVDTGRWGFLARGAYVTSGSSGLWTAPIAALGGTYRLRGDGETAWGIVSRFGVVYQRWSANTGGCPVTLILPNSCSDYQPPPTPGLVNPPPPTYATTVDHVGLFGGFSFEAPVEPFFVAFGAELSATADVDHATPGLAFSGQLTLSIALRNHVHDSLASRSAPIRYYRTHIQ